MNSESKKYYLANIDYDFEEGDTIIFDMPSFCSGDYTAEVKMGKRGLYIDAEDNFFKGCRDFSVIKNKKTNK